MGIKKVTPVGIALDPQKVCPQPCDGTPTAGLPCAHPTCCSGCHERLIERNGKRYSRQKDNGVWVWRELP